MSNLPNEVVSMGNDMAYPVLDRSQTPNNTFQLGLTKRELFAMHLMAALYTAHNDCGDWKGNVPSDAASEAVQGADALLTALRVSEDSK